jgi:uracil-DNA glycosylase
MADALVHLAAEARACRICRDAPLRAPPLADPRPVLQISATARLCIASQAPGLRAHQSGRPFDDRSGDRLRDWMGVTRETFYDERRIAILPMGFCFPGYDAHGGDLPPRRECAARWRRPLFELLPDLELILCIGSYAQAWHLGARRASSMTETVRGWRELLASSGAPRVLPLPHPSWRNTGWMKRHPWFEAELLPTLRSEVDVVLRPPLAGGDDAQGPGSARDEVEQEARSAVRADDSPAGCTAGRRADAA